MAQLMLVFSFLKLSKRTMALLGTIGTKWDHFQIVICPSVSTYSHDNWTASGLWIHVLQKKVFQMVPFSQRTTILQTRALNLILQCQTRQLWLANLSEMGLGNV